MLNLSFYTIQFLGSVFFLVKFGLNLGAYVSYHIVDRSECKDAISSFWGLPGSSLDAKDV